MRRPQILATAVELIREKGLWDVRISDVAKRAGISPASVVYYFGTKDDLLAEAISGADDAFYGPVVAELASLHRASQRLACVIVRSSASDWVLWVDLWVYARHHPETLAAQRRFHRRWRNTIEHIIADGCETEEWEVADPAAAAQRLSALTDGLAVHMVLSDPDHNRDRYIEMSLGAAALELGVQVEGLQRDAEACPPTRAEGL